MLDMSKPVIYRGLKCFLYETYMNDDRPLVKITDSKGIDAAYALGFECISYPDEIVKYLTEEELAELEN